MSIGPVFHIYKYNEHYLLIDPLIPITIGMFINYIFLNHLIKRVIKLKDNKILFTYLSIELAITSLNFSIVSSRLYTWIKFIYIIIFIITIFMLNFIAYKESITSLKIKRSKRKRNKAFRKQSNDTINNEGKIINKNIDNKTDKLMNQNIKLDHQIDKLTNHNVKLDNQNNKLKWFEWYYRNHDFYY